MRWFKHLLGTCSILLLSTTLVFGADPINTLDKKGVFGSFKVSGVALRGYDTVAYFTQSKPVEGVDAYSTEWSGATWKFSSNEHLELFKNDPEKYAPQYGGYCAYGVAMNNLIKIEPDVWTIVDDKLYLNYNAGVKRKWVKDVSGYISKADSKFENLLKK